MLHPDFFRALASVWRRTWFSVGIMAFCFHILAACCPAPGTGSNNGDDPTPEAGAPDAEVPEAEASPPEAEPPADDPPEDEELSCDYQYLNYRGCAQPADGRAYYESIEAELTLEDWRANRCFDQETVSLFYVNHYDLGFGRDMNCTTCGLTISCYVDNYGQPGSTMDEALEALNNGPPAATVAMDYDPSRLDNRVRFYAFDAQGQRTTHLSLDSEGPKALPHVCLTCHGGNYNPETHNITGAAFLEFVPALLEFPNGLDLEETIQLDALREYVLRTDPPAPIARSVRGSSVDGTSYTPPGWEGQENLYQVVQRYCLGCHNAQLTRQFDTFAKFEAQSALIFSAIFESQTMPHAERTAILLQQDQEALQTLERALTEPPFVLCPDISQLDLNGQATGTLPSDQSPSTTGSCAPTEGAEAVFALVLEQSAQVCLSTEGSRFDTVLHIRTHCDETGEEIACNDDGSSSRASLALDLEANTPYYVFVEGFGNSQGEFTLQATPGPCP